MSGRAGVLERAFGYRGDNMNLPVPDLEAALPFYQTVLGFQVSLPGAAARGADVRPGPCNLCRSAAYLSGI